MAGTATPIFPQTIQNWGVSIANADSTNKKTLLSGATNGSKVEYLEVSTDDGTGRTITLYLSDGVTDYQVGQIAVNANAGNSTSIGSAPQSFLAGGNFPSFPYDANGNRFIYVKTGWSLKVALATQATSGKTFWIKSFGSDF